MRIPKVLRNLTRRKLRSSLTISGIVIGIFALTAMGAMAEHFNALLDGGVKYYATNIQVAADPGGLVSLSKASEIQAVPGVASVTPAVMIMAKPGSTNVINFGVPDYISNQTPQRADSPIKLTYASGHELSGTSSGEVVLGSSFAQEFRKKVGDTIALPIKPKDAKPEFIQHTFTVVGILNPTLTAPDNGSFVTLSDAEQLLGDQLSPEVRDKVNIYSMATSFIVYGVPGQNLDQLADRITSSVAGVKATRPSDLVDNFKSGGALFTLITTGAAVLALVIGGLSVANTMIMAVTERVREIGLKKALGAHTGQILREFLFESIAMGLIGGAIGFGLGVIATIVGNSAASSQSAQMFLVTPTLAVIAFGFALALAAVAGVIPALRAARLDPVAALRTM
ncbi:MAG: ABC transporter permease [Candidatus Dormibacterales bacterium]